MPQTKQFVLNNVSGAYTSITPPMACRRAYIVEDASVTAQGLQYQLPDDNFTNVYNVSTPGTPDTPQIRLGHPALEGSGNSPMLGFPAMGDSGKFNARAADTLIKIKSRTGTGTTINITFFD